MSTDVFLFPCSFFFTVGMLSLLWPEVLREFVWSQHHYRRVRMLAWGLFALGLFCWAAHGSCRIETAAALFSLFLIVCGLLLIPAPALGLRSLRVVLLARPGRIRMLGVALLLLSAILLLATSPKPPSYFSYESLAVLPPSGGRT